MLDANRDDLIVVSGVGVATPVASSGHELCAIDARADIACAREDWFDVNRYFGRRGHKYFTPATLYLLAAGQDALTNASVSDERYADIEKGVLIGTNFSDGPVREELDRTILSEGTVGLSPAYAANSSVNIPASNVSIRFGCRAFNITLTNPIVAGIEAILGAKRAIETNRARLVLAGAAEGMPPERAAAFCGTKHRAPGACVFVLERASAALHRRAVIVGGATRFVPRASLEDPERRRQLAARIARDVALLFERRPASQPVRLYSVPSQSALSELVAAAAKDALRSAGVEAVDERLPGSDASHMSVSPMLQLAGLLHQQHDALVIATSPFGHVAILRAAQTL